MKDTKQKRARWLLPEQTRDEDRRLATAYLGIVSALPCRPSPRAWWDNVASPGRANYKGRDAVIASKIAVTAAMHTDSHAILEHTAEKVKVYHQALADASLSPYYAVVTGRMSLAEARVRASKETSEALHAILTSTVERDDRSPATVQEIDEAIRALLDLRAEMVGVRANVVNAAPRRLAVLS